MSRLEHLLDAIDGALTDWPVSTDAMRWAPPEPSEPPMAVKWSSPVPMTDEMLGAWSALGSRFWVINHEPENDSAWRDIPVDDTAWRGPDLEPEPPPRTDVRAHALWQAQHRHTGPQRPAAGQTKRPRR